MPQRKRARPGGIQQRQARADAELEKQSALYQLLMLYLAKGVISGAHCHAVATAAKADMDLAAQGYHFPTLDKLTHVQHGKNLQASVFRMLSREANLPALQEVSLPMQGQPEHESSASVLLPHELFAALHASKQGWVSSILPHEPLLQQFWDTFANHPCMAGHPLHDRPHYRTRCVPLSLHGDEVPITGIGKIWSRSALVLSWSSLVATAAGVSLEDHNLYIYGLFEKFILPASASCAGTMDSFWRLLSWSFLCIWHGEWPKRDWHGNVYPPTSPEGKKAGTPLARGWFGCLVQLCGDMDYFCKYFQTPRWSAHNKCCSHCQATYHGPLSWLDNRPNSGWQGSILTPSNWTTHFESQCALFDLPGLSALSIALDWMHCFFLGWVQHFYGSVFSVLVHHCLPGEPLANLKQIGTFIHAYQRTHAARYRFRPRLDKLTMFERKAGYPKLKGRAADIYSLASPLWEFFKDHMDVDNQQHKIIQLFLKVNVSLQNMLEEFHPRTGFLAIPPEQCHKLYTCGLHMAQLHAQLNDYYASTGERLFNITSKTHACLHVLQLAEFIHPSLVWCFKGEETMQRMGKTWKSCLVGSKRWQVAKKASLKERHLLFLRSKVGDPVAR